MRRISKFFAVAAAAGTVAAVAAAPPASAGLNPHTTQVTNGEAGYYVNDAGGWRIRDAHSQIIVTASMRDLNGNRDGAVGNELCDPNTTTAAQVGLIWNPITRVFEVHYDFGALTAALTTNDPCVNNGLVAKNPADSPMLLVGTHIHAGDILTFDVYYDPAAETLQFTASDVTQDVTRQAILPSWEVGPQNFYEAGIGVLSNNLPRLTPPAVNLVAPFQAGSFNNYGATTTSSSVLGGWDTRQCETLNLGNQVVLSPDSSLNSAGSSFKVFEGGLT